eukprot:2929188-Rhodomonas_salina.1
MAFQRSAAASAQCTVHSAQCKAHSAKRKAAEFKVQSCRVQSCRVQSFEVQSSKPQSATLQSTNGKPRSLSGEGDLGRHLREHALGERVWALQIAGNTRRDVSSGRLRSDLARVSGHHTLIARIRSFSTAHRPLIEHVYSMSATHNAL